MEWERSVELPRSLAHTPQTQLSCCPLHHRAGREPGPISSAVQRSFLDRFGHGGAEESDDGTRVVAAYHSAARHNHVGSGLTQKRNRKIFISKEQAELLAWRVCESLTSAHLWMVSGPTPPSTSMSKDGNWLLNQLTWVTPQTRKAQQNGWKLRERGAGREHLSRLGTIPQNQRYLLNMQQLVAVEFTTALYLVLLYFCIFQVITCNLAEDTFTPHLLLLNFS